MDHLESGPVKMTILGKSPSWQDAGGACSGYLFEEGGTVLLLDCGNGVFGKLREHVDYVDVDAVVISHMHSDHFFDLIPFAFALTYAPRQQPVPVAGWPGTDTPARPALHVPPAGRKVLREVICAFHIDTLCEDAFDVQPYRHDDVLSIGGMEVRFHLVPHFTETHAVEVRSASGGRFTFGADCCPNDALVEFGRGADVMMVEATLPRPERDGIRGHMTPAEAGDHARRAGARRLLLTHISDELDTEWALGEAAQAFGGPVEIAAEGASYEL